MVFFIFLTSSCVLTMFPGVSPERVKIISVSKYVSDATTRSLRKNRHPWGNLKAKTQVQVRVTGALRLKNAEQWLYKYGFARSNVKTKLSWDHHVEARRRLVAG